MPKVNWQQQGSFEQGEIALAYGPSDAPLVCLPPINRYWLPFVLGCLDQLTNPSTWIVADDTALNAILDKAIALKQLVGQAGDCVSCPLVRLQDCVLQLSCDGGSTWTDASGWSANFGGCVQAGFPPPTPPNPGGTPHDQHACNIAGYLATKVIQETMVRVHAILAASGSQLDFATDVMSLIGWAFPLTYSAILALRDFYAAVQSQSLADINTAATDPVLWSDVTCAIYTAIRVVGYVDATNFAAVVTNLGSISYTFVWVAPSLSNYVAELGLGNLQSQQAVGAIDDVDCTGCASPPPYCVPVWTDTLALPNNTVIGSDYTLGVLWTSAAIPMFCDGAYVYVDSSYANLAGCKVILWDAALGIVLAQALIPGTLPAGVNEIDWVGGPYGLTPSYNYYVSYSMDATQNRPYGSTPPPASPHITWLSGTSGGGINNVPSSPSPFWYGVLPKVCTT